MKLFEPLDINGMVIPNRVMVPAMVTHLCEEGGMVNDAVIERYAAYAAGGAGLIVVEAMAVHQNKSGALLRASEDRFIPGLRELTRRVHETSDSKIVPQIIHFMKVARTGWRQTIDTLSTEEIATIVEQFGAAAARVQEAGFDGVELHSAHAYTLSSFLSRTNPRKDEYGGDTLEGRLTLIGQVMANVRRRVGKNFPVCVRFNAEEFIKNGYTVQESKLIAQRFAELGFDYLSLSAGGKFEDAVHTPGAVLFPYSGYSGDRCMPGQWLPRGLHVNLAAEIKAHLVARGFKTPVAIAGKLSDPVDAEALLARGEADMVAIARGLLADPAWTNKVKNGQVESIVQCDYCNVCKQLDGTHKPVICALWPQGSLQAPKENSAARAPEWGADGAGLSATLTGTTVSLRWSKAPGAAGYDIYRSTDEGQAQFQDAAKLTKWADKCVLGGQRYRYQVRPRSTSGLAGIPVATEVEFPLPGYMAAK